MSVQRLYERIRIRNGSQVKGTTNMGIILSKYIAPGSRIELQKAKRYRDDDEEKNKVYASQVVDILSDDRIEISMPMEKTKLILLPVDVEYDLYFFTFVVPFTCFYLFDIICEKNAAIPRFVKVLFSSLFSR